MIDADPNKRPDIAARYGFEKADRCVSAKDFADAKVSWGGTEYLVDVSFSSDPARNSVEAKEEFKRGEYRQNRLNPNAIQSRFVPMTVDAAGRWGPEMVDFFRRVEDTALEELGPLSGDLRRSLRYAKEQISIAVIKSNGRYIHLLRYGRPPQEPQTQEGDELDDYDSDGADGVWSGGTNISTSRKNGTGKTNNKAVTTPLSTRNRKNKHKGSTERKDILSQSAVLVGPDAKPEPVAVGPRIDNRAAGCAQM